MKKKKNFIGTILLRGRILLNREEGFGMNELLGVAAALILAAFIVIPGLKELARSVMDMLESWWGKIVNEAFQWPGSQ
ncbi:MAG TPA: hypothetical protein GXX14_10955 [Clostridiaceae bacterium]|nr:hypothetical protein [Clostridiaceae bacterium]